MPNRLASESSPYLLQHAHNPVDWYPWGDEALARARDENLPIFLSIGYAACHWCHVMERESFEDEATAALMNEHYVCIKVDREERPDLDAIYMQAVVSLTGRGGWPMSVWLTPEGVPFYGGTYFPNVPRFGMPSFGQVLSALAETWQAQPDEVRRSSNQMRAILQRATVPLQPTGGPLDPALVDQAVLDLSDGFDWEHGGWGGAPKFPQPMLIEFLLHHHARTGSELSRRLFSHALTSMAEGGIYDQLGGGFHRYSTDDVWLVPHFEKMLYDNSQLARAYLHAWQATGDPLYRRVTEETLDYVTREMTGPEGGFYSTQDADSEGVEGKFFVWSSDEIEEVLGDAASVFMDAYGVTPGGNFEGLNILHVARDGEDPPRGRSASGVAADLAASRCRLFQARETRVKPGRDEKVLAAWNGLMLATFAEAARVLGRPDYLETAQRNADFVLGALRTPDGRMLRTWRDGRAKLTGYLEDYSHLAEGLLTLYQADFDPRWFVAARDLADQMLARFPADDGGFYDTADDHEHLVTRPRDLQDNAIPSGNAMAVTVLLRLAALTGDARYADTAESALGGVEDMLRRHPTALGQWLTAYEIATGPRAEVAIVGNPEDAGTQSMLRTAFGRFRPHQMVALGRPGVASPVPLLEGREPVTGHPTAWVCRGFACRTPVTEAKALELELDGK